MKKITFHFSAAFEAGVPNSAKKTGHLFGGPASLLNYLEKQFGLIGYPENTDYFRIELYRQALDVHAKKHPNAFYQSSFEADRFATATALLQRRDALLLAGFFQKKLNLKDQSRLQVIEAVESLFQSKIQAAPNPAIGLGFAGRFAQVLQKIEAGMDIPFGAIHFHDPKELLAPHVLRFLALCEKQKMAVEFVSPPPSSYEKTDLGHLKQSLLAGGKPEKSKPKADGSLLILKTESDTNASSFFAQLLEKNPTYRPQILATDPGLFFEQQMIREGLPAPGIKTSSLARPSLQVLKLAPAFLWQPLDVHKVMEFVTLPLKPIEDGFATAIARVLAEKPGLKSDAWFAATLGYIDKHEEHAEELRGQYSFWFDRRRFPIDQAAPKKDAFSIFNTLLEWAQSLSEGNATKIPGLPQLIEQARRIVELLRALPEDSIGFLELERLIRTVYEPAAAQLEIVQKGSIDLVPHEGAFAQASKQLLWWNCVFNETPPSPDVWTPAERSFLEKNSCAPNSPDQKAALRRYHRLKPIYQTQEQLVLVIPANVFGAHTEAPLIWGDIEAVFDSVSEIVFDLDTRAGREKMKGFWALTPQDSIEPEGLKRSKSPVLQIPNRDQIPVSEYETFTNLDSLFHYPHKWFLKSKMRFFAQNILSVKDLKRLQGILAHRFFEEMLKLDFINWTKSALNEWVEEYAPKLLEREGATLLLYGLEPEKRQLISRTKRSAWTLIQIIRDNNWTVKATEMELEGTFADMPIKGKADLVLERGNELAILDIKWSGKTRKINEMKSEKDLQLVLYAHLLPPAAQWAYTAYFILDEGKLIARNRKAFKDATIVDTEPMNHEDACVRIFDKMEKTFRWRMAQIQRGELEVRTTESSVILEEIYNETEVPLLDFLELPNETAFFDDYSILIR